jgi:hypothetical protein
MKRSILSPEQSSWLAQTVERNRRFAGLRMMSDEGGDGADKGADADKDAADADKKSDAAKADDDKLGEGGKKAIEAERARAKTAEDANKALKSEFDGFKSALLEGLGIKSKDDEGKDTDALATVQEQLAAIQHDSAVKDLLIEHRITDKDDIDLLKSTKDAGAMKKLAERLAPKEQDRDATSRRPKPDRTQGGGDGDNSQNKGGSVAQVMAERAAARAAKNKTTSNV